jgi:hypothetical protein
LSQWDTERARSNFFIVILSTSSDTVLYIGSALLYLKLMEYSEYLTKQSLNVIIILLLGWAGLSLWNLEYEFRYCNLSQQVIHHCQLWFHFTNNTLYLYSDFLLGSARYFTSTSLYYNIGVGKSTRICVFIRGKVWCTGFLIEHHHSSHLSQARCWEGMSGSSIQDPFYRAETLFGEIE